MKSSLKKYDFSYNLAGLSQYTDEVGGRVVAEAVAKTNTATIGYVQSGIKGTQALNLLSSNIYPQAGGSCGWNASGTTTWTQRDITTCPYTIQESLCPEALRDYWQGAFLNAGANAENVPFEAAIVELKVKQIQRYLEDKMWNALPASSGGTDCFVGFKGLFGTGQTPSEQVNFVSGPTSPSSSTMLTCVDEVISALPDAVAQDDDLVVMMSMSLYRLYTINLRTANYYNFGSETQTAGVDFVVKHPGTNISVYPINTTLGNLIVCGKASELVVGVDLLSDSERLDMWFSRDNNEVRMQSKVSVGVQIPFPANWVSNAAGI